MGYSEAIFKYTPIKESGWERGRKSQALMSQSQSTVREMQPKTKGINRNSAVHFHLPKDINVVLKYNL